MTVVSQLDLPHADYTDPTLHGARFHDSLQRLSEESWLARTDLGFLVLERQAVIDFLRDHRLVFPAVQLILLQGITDGPIFERTVRGIMAHSGPPHLRLRRLVAPAFTPRSAERLRPRLRAFLDQRWAEVGPTGRTEFVRDFAQPLPSTAIAHLLGTPGQAERLAHWSLMLQAVFKFNMEEDRPKVEQAYREVRDWVLALVKERRDSPGADLISDLATLEVDGDRLSEDECVTLVAAVISGGTDTTQAQLAHGMRLFAEHPEQWDILAERPELADQATTEVLRYEPITPFTARVVVEPFEYRGVHFPEGTVVFACAVTANRDPSAFDRPDAFDITADRGRAPILTFGFGDHFCLGARLARTELAETFGFLAPRMRDLRLDGEPEFGSVRGIYAMERVPLAFSPTDPAAPADSSAPPG